jgi:hypothetical protein
MLPTYEQATQNHDTIRDWVERRSGHAAVINGPHPDAPEGYRAPIGDLCFGFLGYASHNRLEPLLWDEFFRRFDAENATLHYVERERDNSLSYRYRITTG